MLSRAAFLLVAAFWIAMNVLLWRVEYGPRGGGTPVPLDLVCRKILTAPDPSALSVYQNGQKMGFAEFSTSIEQEMAQLDEANPPPEGLVARAGYQIRLTGNVAFGDFTNRVRFDTHVKFSARREWHELDLKLSSHDASVEIHSLATNQTMSLEFTNKDGVFFSRVFTFAELSNPNTLVRTLADYSGVQGGDLDLPPLLSANAIAQHVSWKADRVRLMVGHEPVSAYRLETSVLGQPIVIHVSTLGEILQADLPGGISATLDEWSKP